MHIWLISIFEQTPVDKVFSTRFLSIANEALSRGHTLTFFASTFKHNTKNQRFENTHVEFISEGYEMVFIKSISYEKNISVKRLISHYIFAKDAISVMMKYPKPDVILMAFPPITLAETVSSWAKKEGIPIAMDIIDPWPDTFKIAAPKVIQPLLHPFLAPMRASLKSTLKNITALTAISKQYIDWASSYYSYVPIKKVFYPAADLEVLQNSVSKYKTNKKDDELTVIYAGSLSLSYDLDCILGAAKILENSHPKIKFLIAGAGKQEEKIREYEKTHNNLHFLGRLNKLDLLNAYSQSDLGCTQHIKGATQSVTYKLFDLLSCGLPILNSLESEMKDIIIDNEVGLHNSPGDSQGLANNILFFYNNKDKLHRYRENGFLLTKENGDSKIVYKGFIDLLEVLNESTN